MREQPAADRDRFSDVRWGDYGAYPSYANSQTRELWTDGLVPYLSANWTNDIYRCPGNPLKPVWIREPAMGRGQFINGVSYDMNAYGVGWNNAHGLAVRIPVTYQGSPSTSDVGCKESQVVSPGEMIAYGDAVLDVYFPFSALGHAAWFQVHSGAWYERSRSLMRTRHRGIWNIVFAAGHIERFKTNLLFGKNKYDPADDEMRRRWNRDHEPHWEELSRPTGTVGD